MTSKEERRLQAAPVCDLARPERVNRGAPNIPARGTRSPCGFTLLEIMIALGVLGLLMSALYGSYRVVAGSILGIRPQAALAQRGRFFIQQLSRQVRCCYGGPVSQPSQTSVRQSDVAESLNGRDSVFQGGRVSRDKLLLRYVTSYGTRSRREYPGCLTVVSYRLDSRQHKLLVREDIYGRRSKEDDKDWRVVLEDVQEIEFEYFDGEDWYSEWDSTESGGLPRAMRVKLLLGSTPDGGTEWAAVVPILCSRAAANKVSAHEVPTTGYRRDE